MKTKEKNNQAGIYKTKVSSADGSSAEVSSVEEFDRIKYPILIAPFYDRHVCVMVKELSHVECKAIGDFSLIPDFHSDAASGKKINYHRLLEYTEIQMGIVRASLVKPKYDDLVELIGKRENFDAAKKEISELNKLVQTMKPGPSRSNFEAELDRLEIVLLSVFPENFTAFISGFALGVDKTDIVKLSESILRDAAIAAELAHNDPSDHIGGKFERWAGDKLFTEDINNRARYILYEERKFNTPKKSKRSDPWQ